MRPLVFDFPADEAALQQSTEYMFGPALLVCPVTEPDVRQWSVYLPSTSGGWYDWRTGQRFDGGRRVDVPVDEASIPVFARAGSILPLAGDTLALFPGADATFTLYEDDGVSTAYEQGACSRITFRWDDHRQRLTVDRRRGSFPAMTSTRHFVITLPDGTAFPLDYQGKAVKRKLPLHH